MTTNKEFADKLIAGNGRIDQEDASDNPPATRIVKYLNAWGGIGYGVTFPHEDINKYLIESEYIRNPEIYWERKSE